MKKLQDKPRDGLSWLNDPELGKPTAEEQAQADANRKLSTDDCPYWETDRDNPILIPKNKVDRREDLIPVDFTEEEKALALDDIRNIISVCGGKDPSVRYEAPDDKYILQHNKTEIKSIIQVEWINDEGREQSRALLKVRHQDKILFITHKKDDDKYFYGFGDTDQCLKLNI